MHAAAEGAVAAADDFVGLEEETRADGVGVGGNEGGATLEAGDGVLLDGEGVEDGADAVGLGLPVLDAIELGGEVRAMPTNGNAGAAWAVYCAAAGIKAVIVMPEDAPPIPRGECAIAGASLYLVKGLISDAGKIVARAVADYGWFDASTLKEPYRIEGKKLPSSSIGSFPT